MKTIRVVSPTRVDLSGGTIDLWPIYAMLGGGSTINMAIDIYTAVEIKDRIDEQIHLNIEDLNYKKVFGNLSELLKSKDKELLLFQSHLNYWKPTRGFEMSTKSQSPVGGGLGGSSSLTVSLIKAFSIWMKRYMDSDTIVRLATNLEAEVLKVPTGTQDYYPAELGGLLVIDYKMDGAHVEKLSFDPEYFASRSFLVYTGKPHQSGLNNWQILKDFIDGKQEVKKLLESIQNKSEKMRTAVYNQNWDEFRPLFQLSYQLRTTLSSVFSSPEIVRLQGVVKEAGGDAIKICGAGGGGCVFVWTQPQHKQKVVDACQGAGFQVLLTKPVEQGSQVQVF